MGAKNFYGLTKPQQTIWFSEQFTDAPINNLIGVMYFKKDINIDLLTQATNLVVKNNDALRTILVEQDGTVMQFFDDFKPFNIEVFDLTQKTPEYIENFRQNYYRSKVSLLGSRLFDFIILLLPTDEICMIGKFHHIIVDAWSLGLVIDNIAINYSNLALNANISLPITSYSDFIEREKNYLASDVYSKNMAFWLDKLNNFNPISLKTNSSVSF